MSRIEDALAKAAGLNSSSAKGGGKKKKHSNAADRPPLKEREEGRSIRLPEETMVVVNEPFSPMAEEFRKLKEALVKMTKGERFDNLIAVTSATVGEGKSMTAINLAATLAREFDHTALLVDADLRRPSVHKYLNLGSHKGLSDCLREGLDVGDLLVRTDLGKLTVLPAGTPVPNPVEFFTSDTMRRIFLELKNRYPDRYIIIDTPPVLPFAESRSIASIADGVVLVVKEGQPTLDQIQEAIEALENKVLGIVYNGAHLQDRSSYYYYSE